MLNNESSPTVTHCTFIGNSAGVAGGGIKNAGNCNTTVTNCIFTANSAKSGGGMGNHDNSSPTVDNCTFSGNSAVQEGGGMNNSNGCSPTLTNCTFSDNSSGWAGGGMYNFGGSRPTLTNCILWGNTAPSGPQIYNDGRSSSATVSYSDVKGSWPGTGNINADPLFLDPNDGDLRLLPGSACIDAGDNTVVPPDMLDLDRDGNTAEPIPFDIEGRPRFVDQYDITDTGYGTAPIVDMGAFEANYIEVAMKFTPQALNLRSKGKWLKAHLVLPEGFDVNDVDTNTRCHRAA
ncbi:MAG: right-handed parallel beta-helix repeat-containing protein, partial [Planctomycetota bacterium]